MNPFFFLAPFLGVLLVGCGWSPILDPRDPGQDTGPTQGKVNDALIYAAENYSHPFVPGELIIGASPAQAASGRLATALKGLRLRGQTLLTDPEAPARAASLVILGEATREGVLQAIQQLKGHPDLAYAEPNYLLSVASEVPDDPLYPQQWALSRIGATSAWAVEKGDPGVTVGVIDSGIDYTHVDLAANLWRNPGEIPGNGIDDDQNHYVDDVFGWNFFDNNNNPMDTMTLDNTYHGTHVAGIIAAIGNNGVGVTGVTWTTTVAALKIFGSNGQGPSSGAIQALQYAIRMRLPIVNSSWGGAPYMQSLFDVLARAETEGILVVAAGGNGASDNDSSPYYPASYRLGNIVSVAATDAGDSLAAFSQWGRTTVDLAAPGTRILSTANLNGYQILSGTSMAAPLVSGAAALLKAQSPTETAWELKRDILLAVDPLPALADKVLSGGRLNVARLLEKNDPVPGGTLAFRSPSDLILGDGLFFLRMGPLSLSRVSPVSRPPPPGQIPP